VKPAVWIASLASWLNPRRLRAQAMLLALCLWGVCVADYSTPGLFDRAGNIKFQDFFQFPVSANLIAQGRADELYNPQILTNALRAIAGPDTSIRLQYFYGPQVALPFIPLRALSFLAQGAIWVAFSVLLYLGCVYLIWTTCTVLKPYAALVALCAIAYPPMFHFFVRGQISALPLVCFTAAYLAFRARRGWLVGIALGFLFVKPQFLVAVPFVLLFGKSWRAFAGLVISAAAQLGLTFAFFGKTVMRAYFNMLLHSASQPGTTELSLSSIQMHSLRSFWALLIPWPGVVWALYVTSSVAVIALAVAIWRSSPFLTIRFSSLLVAAVLVNPHLYIYDLLGLLPALLLMADWAAAHLQHPRTAELHVLLYLSFLLPLLGPISRWTHVQLSVLAFSALLCVLWRISSTALSSPRELATSESAVV
jgi:Glycosyltransferase family 87